MTTIHISQSGQPLELVLEDGCTAEISEGRIVVRGPHQAGQGPWWTYGPPYIVQVPVIVPYEPPYDPFRIAT